MCEKDTFSQIRSHMMLVYLKNNESKYMYKYCILKLTMLQLYICLSLLAWCNLHLFCKVYRDPMHFTMTHIVVYRTNKLQC